MTSHNKYHTVNLLLISLLSGNLTYWKHGLQAFNSLALEDSLEDRIHIEEVDSPLHEYLASRSDYLSSKDEDENFNRFSDYHQYFGDVEICSIPNSPSLGRVLDSSNINLSRSLPRSTRFGRKYFFNARKFYFYYCWKRNGNLIIVNFERQNHQP